MLHVEILLSNNLLSYVLTYHVYLLDDDGKDLLFFPVHVHVSFVSFETSKAVRRIESNTDKGYQKMIKEEFPSWGILRRQQKRRAMMRV